MFAPSSLKTIPLVAAMTAALMFGAAAHAQTAASTITTPPTSAEVKTNAWTPKAGVQPPAGMKSRAEVRAETRQFLATHTFDEVNGVYVEKPQRKAQ